MFRFRMTSPGLLAGVVGLLIVLGCVGHRATEPYEPEDPAVADAQASPGAIPSLDVQLCWSGEVVTLPGPIDANKTVFPTKQYRDWQFTGTTNQLTYTGADGKKIEIKSTDKPKVKSSDPNAKKESKPGVVGADAKMRKMGKSGGKKRKGISRNFKSTQPKFITNPGPIAPPEATLTISRYRADGTLEVVTSLHEDSSVDSWMIYGPDGKTRQVKVQLRAREGHVGGLPLIQYVNFYEPDRIRQIHVNEHNVAWQELVVSETGNIRERLHEDTSKADKLKRLGTGTGKTGQ